jgi:hypothetical protein
MKTFDEDFDYFWKRIFEYKIPTAFARYADGEAALIRGRPIGSDSMVARVDGWSAPDNTITQLGLDLRRSIKRDNPNYFYAISCTCCDKPTRDFLTTVIKTKNLTFANLWINGHYKQFKSNLETITDNVYIIGNERGLVSGNFPFPIDYFPIGTDCINFWKINKVSFLQSLTNRFKLLSNPLVLVAAGPMSELIIDHLWTINPTGRYIDVGSALDEFIFGYKTREYMDPNSIFNKRICYV